MKMSLALTIEREQDGVGVRVGDRSNSLGSPAAQGQGARRKGPNAGDTWFRRQEARTPSMSRLRQATRQATQNPTCYGVGKNPVTPN